MVRLPLLPPLPSSTEGRLVLVVVVLGSFLALAGREITKLQGVIAARPAVLDSQVDERTEDFRRGPVKRTRTEITAVDGTKTAVFTEEIASEERRTGAKTAKTHQETPTSTRSRMRYMGLGIDPLDYARFPRLRAGVTVFSALDLGISYDSRFRPVNGAFGIEAAYRF